MMKSLLITLFLITNSIIQGYAQVSIDQITMSPINPTENDTIYFYVNKSFLEGPYSSTSSTVFVVGDTIFVETRNCFSNGFLYLPFWNVLDTFKVNPLSSGNYTFKMQARAGSRPFFNPYYGPCSYGIIPNDKDNFGKKNFNFFVDISTGISTNGLGSDPLSIYPNPSKGKFFIKLNQELNSSKEKTIRLISIDGRIVKELKDNLENKLELELPGGIYYLQLLDGGELLKSEKIIITE